MLVRPMTALALSLAAFTVPARADDIDTLSSVWMLQNLSAVCNFPLTDAGKTRLTAITDSLVAKLAIPDAKVQEALHKQKVGIITHKDQACGEKSRAKYDELVALLATNQ